MSETRAYVGLTRVESLIGSLFVENQVVLKFGTAYALLAHHRKAVDRDADKNGNFKSHQILMHACHHSLHICVHVFCKIVAHVC